MPAANRPGLKLHRVPVDAIRRDTRNGAGLIVWFSIEPVPNASIKEAGAKIAVSVKCLCVGVKVLG